MYCLRVAKTESKAVVINCSFGTMHEAGDGLDATSRWLDQTFDPGHAADDKHFPKGAILVQSSGNSGDPDYRSYARITVPDSGAIVVPLEMYESRGPNRTTVENCTRTPDVKALSVSFWYRDVSAPQDVAFAARVPTEAAFSNDVFAGRLDKTFDGGKTRTIFHETLPAVQRPDGAGGTVAVRRNRGFLTISPSTRSNPPQHRTGIYDWRIAAPAGTVVFANCVQSRGYGFRVASNYANGDALPAAVTIAGSATPITPIEVTGTGTINGDGGARNVITVAAYDDTNGIVALANHHALADFSSKGPIRDFSNPPLGPLSEKPDIAAPGVLISAAQSKDTDFNLVHVADFSFQQGKRFEVLEGTSMAAPAVAGVIALMLEKNKDMSVDDVRDALTDPANVRDGARPVPGDPGYTEGFGAGMVDAVKSHAAA
jgi:subtilisin family serine protease